MRVLKVRQHDVTDCGPACLRSIAGTYGMKVSIAKLRQFASTDRRGTNILGLIEAAEAIGFSAKGLRGPIEGLPSAPMPAIAHVIVGGRLDHFVVVERATSRAITVMDPLDGRRRTLPSEEFAKLWTGALVVLLPNDAFRPLNTTSSPAARFWDLIAPHRSVLLEALIGSVVITILGLSTSIYVQKIVDNVLVDGNRNLLHAMSIAMIVVILAQTVLGAFKGLISTRTAQAIDARLVLGYYRHLLSLPQRFFDDMRVGEITSRIADAVKVRTFVNDVALGLLVNVMVVTFSTCFMLLYSWKLAVVGLSLFPIFGLLVFITNRFLKTLQRKSMERQADLQSQLVESLSTASTIKRLDLVEIMQVRTEGRFVDLLRVLYRGSIVALTGSAVGGLATQLSTVALLWVGSEQVLGQSLTPGELMSCYALLGYLTGPIVALANANKSVQDALIAADRLYEILDLESEATDVGFDISAADAGDIRLDAVSFRYGTRASVFENLTLHLPAGKTTAVVGESGSGKSTLAAILQGIYEVSAGHISIGVHGLSAVSKKSLRRLIGVVPQRVELFNASVLENITIGDRSPDRARVDLLVQSLGVDQMVEKLPGGLFGLLTEGGNNLSGGERQRIAIARALYRQPWILILDEATSALDSISEGYVRRTLAAHQDAGRTLIIIAHRLSTIRHADQIVVLEGGRVAQIGTHDELLLDDGEYARLWKTQHA